MHPKLIQDLFFILVNNLKQGEVTYLWGVVCQYFKENLTLKMIGNSSIAQCIICEITLQNQKGYVVVTYRRSPSQSSTELDDFLSNFDKLQNYKHIKQFRPSFTIILGNFHGGQKMLHLMKAYILSF